MRERNYFGAMMVELGQADALISGLTRQYPDTIRPALQIIGRQEGVNKVSGMYILLTRRGPIFFSDTTINFHPTTEELVDITVPPFLPPMRSGLLISSRRSPFCLIPILDLLTMQRPVESAKPSAY